MPVPFDEPQVTPVIAHFNVTITPQLSAKTGWGNVTGVAVQLDPVLATIFAGQVIVGFSAS